jgi:hypothetical protein
MLPPAAPVAMAAMAAINPLEQLFMSINTNPYFIGLMMLMLNLGGRFLGMEVSKEQEKVFQHPIVRKLLIFTVLFVATRNIFVALIMTVITLLLISFLFNENSDLCLWKTETEMAPTEQQPGFTPEETEIWRRLNEKQMRMSASKETDKKKDGDKDKKLTPEAAYSFNILRLNQ